MTRAEAHADAAATVAHWRGCGVTPTAIAKMLGGTLPYWPRIEAEIARRLLIDELRETRDALDLLASERRAA